MYLCEYLESLYYRWKYRKLKNLVRSKVYEEQVKKLLLEDLNSMKFAKVLG